MCYFLKVLYFEDCVLYSVILLIIFYFKEINILPIKENGLFFFFISNLTTDILSYDITFLSSGKIKHLSYEL